MLLDTTAKSITAKIEAGATTTNPVFSTTVATFGQPSPSSYVPAANEGALNGTSSVTVVAAPSSGNVTQVKELIFYNADTVQHTITITLTDGSTNPVIGAFPVPSLQTLRYSDSGGFVLGAASAAILSGAATQSTPSNPTAPASTSAYKMQGLAGAITPKKSGTVLFLITGYIVAPASTTVDNGITLQGYYGTGSAPANAAATTGTQSGNTLEYTHSVAPTAIGDVHYPFAYTFLATGLTVGTAYWFDLAAQSVTNASDVGIAGITMNAIEL